MSNIILKIHSATKTIAEHTVVTKDGQPTIIKAQNRVNYELLDPTRGTAPDHIVAKRVGKDLHISLEKEGKDTDIIIEDYYDDKEANLIGIAEDGQYHYYIPDTGEMVDYVTELAAGDIEGHALGGETEALLAPWWTTAGTTGGSILPWLAGAAAVVGVAAAASGSSSSGDNATTPTTINAPAQPVAVANPNNLTDAEKQAVKEAIKAANPELNLTDDQITVGNDGTATVTPEGQEPTEFTPAQTVANNTEEPAAVNPPAQPVEAVDPTNLTDAEKQAVKEAIKAANPELNLTDDQITVGNDGTAQVTPEGATEPTTFTPAQTVANNTEEPAAVNPPAQPVEAVDPTNLTDAEKQAVKDAIKAANPELNLTDDQITVGNDGTATVTPEGQEPTEFTPAQTVTNNTEEPAAVNPPAQPVEAVDPTNLTDAEKQAVKEAIKAANPELNLTDDQITVGNDGTAQVTPEGQEPTEFTPAQTVTNNTEEPAAVNPPAQPVEAVDPTNLTDAEKQAVKDAIKAANPELNLTDDQITVGNDGTATVTPEGQEPTEFTPAQTVANNTEEPAAVNPPAQPVEAVDPTNLTDAEKQAVKEAIKAANPELNLTDDQITVGNDGTATVTPEGQEPTEFTPAQTVTNNTEEPAAVNPPAQPVEAVDPTNLTDAEKQAVKDAIKAANPELNLTDDQITVGNDGTATVTPEGQEPTEFTPAQTVANNTEEPAAVNPPAQPVEAVDPTNLTDAEKQAVKEAIKAANPELNLTDDQITVGNDGTAQVTPEGQEPTTFTPAQTVANNTEEPAAVNPPAQPVEAVDPTNLTDAEKQAVKEAIKAANPELNLTDDQITVGNDGTATVTPEGQEPTEFTPAQTVTNNTEEPAAVNPPAQPVEAVDPTNLTDAEKQAVKEAIKAANPELNLTDDQITVGNDGTATVTPEGQEPTEFTPAQTVTNNTEEPAAVNPPAQPVEAVDPTNLTDAEKQAVKEAIKAANPELNLTDDQITVGNDGTAQVTPEGATEPTTFTPAQTVANNTEEPAAVNPPAQPVEAVDPTNLTDAEKQAVKEAIKAANPELNLTDDQITVGNDGTATVTPEGQEPTEFTPAQTVTNNTEEPAAVNPPAQPVEAVDPTNLTDAEKQAVKEAIKAANPELNLTDDQITVGNDGTATVTPEGQEPTEFTPAQTVANNTEEPAAVNPPAQPVEAVDPTNLTDAEKQAVKEAIKAANPELNLTDDQITVGNDGTAQVTPEGATEPTTFTPAQTVANNTEEQPDPEQPRDIIPPVVDVEPKAKDGAALPAGTVTVTPGADNDRLVINYTDETGIVHGVTETTKGQEKTLTFVKQGDTWALEQGELPTGVTVEGGVITFAPNSVLDGSRVTATGHKADLTAQHQGNAKDDSQEGDRGWSVYGTETESFTYNLSGANVTWTAGDNGDLMLRGVPANEHLIVEYTDNDGVRRSVEVARGREVGIANDARWYQVTDAEGNAISPSLLTNDFGTNIIRHVDRTANSSLNRFVLDGTKVKDGTAVMAWEKSNGDANGGEDIFLDSSSVGTGDQAVGNAITETLNKSRKDLTWNADTGFFEVSEAALAAPNGRESSWGIAPTKTPTTPTDPVDTIDVIANEGGSVTIVPGADNEKIVVTYYDETGSVKGVEGMAGKTHTFNEVTTDDASADDAEPVTVTVGANNQVTVTLVKQNGAWVEEGKSALPDGFSMDGDNIKIAHNSIMGETEITVSATNSTTAAAATDTGTVLLDDPTNDVRKVHFQKFGELSAEAQAYYKKYAGELYAGFTADSYVIFDGTDINAGKVHNAYVVETANDTKYYVMEKDIWYVADENLNSTGKEVNGSDDTFLVHHDTFIFKDSTLGTLPEGSTVRVWGINKDRGGNWEFHDTYVVPEAPSAPKATNTVVDIAVGLDQDDTTVTTSDLTRTDVAFSYRGATENEISWGSGDNVASITLDAKTKVEPADEKGNVTFGTLTHANNPSNGSAPSKVNVIGSISVTVNGKTEILNNIELGELYFLETTNTQNPRRIKEPENDDFFVFVPNVSAVTINGKDYLLSMDQMESSNQPQNHQANREDLYSRVSRPSNAVQRDLKAVMDSVASRSDISYVRSTEMQENTFDFKVKVVPLNGSTTSTTTEGSGHALPDSYEGAVPTEAGATWKSKAGGNVDVADNGNGSFTVSKAGQVLGEFSGDTNGNYSFKPAAGVKSLADNDVATTTFQFGDKHEVTFNLNAMSYDEYAALPNTKKVDSVYKVTEGDNLDFAAIGNNAEVIDLGSVSAKLSNISSAEVKAHTQGSLYIRGQADDTIDLDGWTKGAATQATTLVADNNTYDTYTSGDATLYIQQGINVV